jgi:hypothetical protein
MDRAQLSLPVIEVGVGIVLVVGVLTTFALGVPDADTAEPQLDAYAEDAATVLTSESPRHQGATRLAEVVRSPAAFDREKAALERRVDRILPDNLLFRVETARGAVGYEQPPGAAVGSATVTTTAGDVTVRVWYA